MKVQTARRSRNVELKSRKQYSGRESSTDNKARGKANIRKTKPTDSHNLHNKRYYKDTRTMCTLGLHKTLLKIFTQTERTKEL